VEHSRICVTPEKCWRHRRALALTPVSSGLAGHIFLALPGQKKGFVVLLMDHTLVLEWLSFMQPFRICPQMV
jgi:hypothetical protein